MNNLTEKQQELLDFIIEFKKREGFAPTVREMADRFGIWPKSIFERLKYLEKKGAVEIEPKIARGIRVLRYTVIDGEMIRIGIPGTSIMRVR